MYVESSSWSERFSYVFPVDVLREKIRNLHEDLSTPWTYSKMLQHMRGVPNIQRKVLEHLVIYGTISPKYQMAVSQFVHEVESGRLRVYYKNPETRRWVCKRGQKPDTSIPRAELQKRNKIITEYHSGDDVPPLPQRKMMQVTFGAGGIKMRRVEDQRPTNHMPSFSRALRGK